MSMKKILLYTLGGILFIAALVGLDQYTKYLAVTVIKENGPVTVIKNIFELSYVENRGAAFGILQGKQIFFFVMAVLFLMMAVYFFYTVPFKKRYLAFKLAVLAISAGGIGNMIDRLSYKYVIDFLYIKAINFPVFNVADCYVTFSAVLIAILILFVYKDEDLRLMFRSKKGKQNKTENK